MIKPEFLSATDWSDLVAGKQIRIGGFLVRRNRELYELCARRIWSPYTFRLVYWGWDESTRIWLQILYYMPDKIRYKVGRCNRRYLVDLP